MERPSQKEYAAYYNGYISLVPNGNLLQILEKQNEQFCEFLAQVDEHKADFRYAKNKWSIKEVIGHIIDVELVFLYRALRISRKDKTNIPGFDQDNYVTNSTFSDVSLSDLVEQFYNLRKTSIAILSSFSDKMWKQKGKANSQTVSVRALGYIMAGHVIHHMKVIHTKYLN